MAALRLTSARENLFGELHQGHGTAWNSRPTNHPTVRVPSTSTRTTSPGEPGTG